MKKPTAPGNRSTSTRKRSARKHDAAGSALHQSEFLDALLESIPVRIFLKDTHGVLIACNSLVAADFGLRKEDMVGKHFESFATPELTAAAARTDDEVLRTRKPLVYEPRELTPSGTWRYGVVTKSPYFNADGSVAGLIAVLVDTTEVRVAEEQLRLSAAVFEHSAEGMYVADRNNRIVQVNPAFSTITGYPRQEAIGRNPRFLGPNQENPEVFPEMWAAVQRDGVWHGELETRRRNGELFPAWCTISAVRNAQGESTHYIGIFYDISARKADEERLRWLANHDVLTGLANRSLLEDRIEQALRRARREQSAVALMLLDLNDFKPVNDQYGHHVGDEILRHVARGLEGAVRQTDTVARIGGDEFVVLAADMDGRNAVETLANKVLAAVSSPVTCAGRSFTPAVSIGISLFPDHGRDAVPLLQAADGAMYRIKESGRSAWHICAAGAP